MTIGWAFSALAAAQSVAPETLPPETVAEFLKEADALEAEGQLSAGSAKARALMDAVQFSAKAFRAALAEAQARGEKPFSCPPPRGQAHLSLSELIGDFKAVPPANRQMPVATAFALVMTLRFPCPDVSQ